MKIQDAYQVEIMLQPRAPSGNSNFDSTAHGTARHTLDSCVIMYTDAQWTGSVTVGEPTHDHDIVQNVTFHKASSRGAYGHDPF